MATKRNQHNKPTNGTISELPQRQAANYLSTYSNYVEIGSSPWDFRILFFEVTEDETGKLIREKKARVVMSPQQAVGFTQVLNHQVNLWMKKHASSDAVEEIKELHGNE